MRKILFSLTLLVIADAVAEKMPYERYEPIVQRQMFGPLPPNFDPTKLPSEVAKTSARGEAELTKEQEQVKKSIRFSVINQTPSGETMVGFTDNADPKDPIHYYLKVGETQNGWTVVEADQETATMTIRKDDIEVTLTLGGDSNGNAGSVSRVAAGGRASRTGSALLSNRGGGSLRERRRQREAAEEAQRKADAEARAQKEAEEKAERDAEKAAQDQERENQRKQLLAIQEELKKAREERAAAAKEKSSEEKTDEE